MPTTTAAPRLWFWAKLGRNTWPDEYHPVVCHLVDVGQVAAALWHHALRDPVRRRVAGGLGLADPAAAGRWVAFWVAAHDIGKLTPCFQFQGQTLDLKARLAAAGFPAASGGVRRHTETGTRILAAELARREPHRPAVAPAVARKIAVAVGGHHGTFPADWDGIVAPLGGDAWSNAHRDLLADLSHLFGLSALPAPSPPPGGDQSVWMLLAGLTSVADWIGSNVAFFPRFVTPARPLPASFDSADYFRRAGERAEQALETLGWLDRAAPTGVPVSFAEATGIPRPRALQDRVIPLARASASTSSPCLTIVEAPMGEGKTEAAWYVADCWDRCGGQGTYVALPTMATGNQMFDRVGAFLAAAPGKSNYMLLHGKAALNDRFRELQFKARVYDEDGRPSGVVAEGWFAANKKHGLLAPFGVGTVDQALLAVLQTRHVFVRLFGLAGKCVILDEVHAYDVYMTTLMERLLRWLAALGCPVVLLSATLPTEKRLRLLRAYAGDDTEDPAPHPYPRVTTAAVGSTPSVLPFEADPSRRKEIRLEWIEGSQLAGNLGNDLSGGGCAAVIRNTVGLAQETYVRLKAALAGTDAVVELFHARFPFGRRKQIEDDVLAKYGKGADGQPENPLRPKRAVLVATQVVEQSLDLDFDVMYTDVAPVDLVLQRAGRLHRHERGGRGQPRLGLIKPENAKDGVPDFGAFERRDGRGVYDKHVLLRTYLELQRRQVILLPDEIDPMVTAVYRSEGPAEPSEWRDALVVTNVNRLAEEKENQKAAGTFAIPEPVDEDDILERFSRELQDDDDPRMPAGRRAMTRLSEHTVQVILLYDSANGLSLDPQGVSLIDVQSEPDIGTIRDCLCNAVSLSHKPLVCFYETRNPPAAWETVGMLRYHRVIPLKSDGNSADGEFPLSYCPNLGIRFVRSEEVLQ